MAVDRAEWHRYYTERRGRQQSKQLELVGALDDPGRILEIGPAYGYVTALLVNAGYEVATLDLGDRDFAWPNVPHISCDLTQPLDDRLNGFDTILCCETLEHLPWETAGIVLSALRRTSAKRLIVSVPYESFQLFFEAYFNGHVLKQRSQWKAFRRFKTFKPWPDPLGHKWEVGYKGTRLKDWEAHIRAQGWRIAKRDFTSPTRSVFHVLEPA